MTELLLPGEFVVALGCAVALYAAGLFHAWVDRKRIERAGDMRAAVYLGNASLVKRMASRENVACRFADMRNKSPLHLAAEENEAAILLELIRHADNLNLLDDEGNTPLHDAARSGSVEAFIILVAEGADMCIRNHSGHTPESLLRNADFEADSDGEGFAVRFCDCFSNCE